jgi:hypothetical protein
MGGAIPPLPQYALIAWCSVKAQGQLYLFIVDVFCTELSASELERRYKLIVHLKNVIR